MLRHRGVQIFSEVKVSKVRRCSSSLLAAGRAELRRTQLTRSSRRHIEGAAGCRLTTQCYGAQLRWKGWLSIHLDPEPTLSTFQVGGNRSTRRKPTTFGRALTNSSHMSVASPNQWSEPTISEVKGACPDDCTTKAPSCLSGIVWYLSLCSPQY